VLTDARLTIPISEAAVPALPGEKTIPPEAMASNASSRMLF
jgi:hypothetical protein